MRSFITTLIIVYLSLNQLDGQVSDSLKFKSIPPTDFQMSFMSEDRAMLVDVREFFEYRKSRLKGAVNIPSSGNLDLATDTLNKDISVFLYCTSGFRSKRVAKVFCTKGFTKVYSLEGGIVAWRKAKLEVDKKRRHKN
jgi:rhodanese-related sulfurtransferase